MSNTIHTDPVNLLACDGGGIRGVSELVVLDEVMKRVKEKKNLAAVPKPCEYFHLLAGTSTGGLVAIMLGRLEMSTEQALDAYDIFASEIFSKKNKNRFNPLEKYRAKALEKSVQKLVQDHGKGTLLRDSRPYHAKGRTFICTMPLQDRKTTVRLRTYDVNHDKYSNCLIYEAARATTAATTFFRPMTLKDDQGNEQKFADAALGRNNPITLLPEEAISLYGTRRRLGCVVSLGTGSREAELMQPGKGILEKLKEIASLVKVLKDISTDTQRDHENMVKMFKDFPGVYFRFDVEGGAEGIRLDQWEKIDELKARTRAYLQRPEVITSIDDLAEALVQGNPHGLNLGHLGGLDKDIIIRETQAAKPRGMASTIFTGRESIMKRLKTYFDRGDSDNRSRKEYHLWGMGGVGKTQIALKFSEECERNNSLKIFWIDATDSVTIKQSYLRIAQKLLPVDQQGPEAAVQKILGLLETTDKWLLVFDNAPDTGLAHYMPDGNRGNIIYTSRQKKLERRILPDCRINVNEMEIGDATTLLLRSARMATDNVETRPVARQLAKELGSLPLALDQAGAYIHMTSCPIATFLEKFEEQKETLLRNPKCMGEDNIRNLPVYATFNISYEAIKSFADKRREVERAEEATYALQLLHLLCFYHNEGSMGAMFSCAAMTSWLEKRVSHNPLQADGVSLDHFVEMLHYTEGGKDDDFDWQSRSFDLGIGFLEEFSLIRYDYDNMYSNMHILVHDWARARMTKRQRAEWGLAARRILIDSLPETEHRLVIIHRREMLPHVDACTKFVKGVDYDFKLESKYLHKIATLYEEADRPEAETAYLRALSCAARELGHLDKLTLEAMLSTAVYYDRNHRDKEAEALYLETIDRMVIKEDEERWRKAEEKQRPNSGSKSQQASADARLGEALDSSELRNAKLMLAYFYYKLGRLDDAEKHTSDLIEWGRRIRQTGTGDDKEDEDVRRARDLEAQIAGQDPSLLNLPGARRMFEEAKEAHGLRHHDTALMRKILVSCLLDKEKYKEAQVHLHVLAEWYSMTYGPDSTEVMDNNLALGRCFLSQRRPWESLWLASEVLLKYCDRFGRTHDKTVDCTQNLARFFFEAGMFERAIQMAAECLSIRRETLGPEHPQTRYSAFTLHKFREESATLPLFHRLRWVQQVLYITKVALQKEGELFDLPMPEWLAEWNPTPVEPMLTADGTEVRFVKEMSKIEGGTIARWRALDEAAFIPDQRLVDVVPPQVAVNFTPERYPPRNRVSMSSPR